jgi:hypothetical protein
MEESCRKVNGTLAVLEKDQKAFVQGLGQMQTVSNTARGRVAELTAAFTDLSAQYNRLTAQEKQGDFGRALSSSLDKLKSRIQESRAELDQISNSLKSPKSGMEQLSGVVNTFGSKLGVTGNLTEMLTSRTAMLTAGISASIVVISKATQEWAKYNSELAKQDQITTVTTGLKGTDADNMTDQARALVDTYNVDFREAINAANVLMTQFGKSGEEAMDLIRNGMRGMIHGDGPKLLQMIQQYAPTFRDAGIAADQLVAIIQNSEGGLFTDQNMNAIVMGIKNIRLMTKSTSEALAKLGIDGQEMTKKLNDGSMTIFEAMQQVSKAINNAGGASQAEGEVMQQVFGRQGVAAGTKLGEAIATLNTNLEETKRQTGELGDSYDELYEANERLNKAIRQCFEYDGWEQMATSIKANLVTALAYVVEKLGGIRRLLFGINGKEARESLGGDKKIDQQIAMLGNGKSQRSRNTYNRQVADYESYIDDRNNYLNALQMWRQGDRSETIAAAVQGGRERFGIDERKIRQQTQAAYGMLEDYRNRAKKLFETPLEQTVKNTAPKNTDPKKNKKEDENYAADSIRAQEKAVEELTKKWKTCSEELRDGVKKELDEAKKKLAEMNGTAIISGSIADYQEQIKKLNEERQKLTDPVSIAINDQAIKDVQAEIDRLNGKTVPIQVEADTSGLDGFGAKMMDKINAEMADANIEKNTQTLATFIKNGIAAGIEGMDEIGRQLSETMLNDGEIDQPVEQYLEEIKRKLKGYIDEKDWPQIELAVKNLNFKPIEEFNQKVEDAARKTRAGWNAVVNSVARVGSALNSIEDPTAKIIGTIMQGIAEVAQGAGSAIAKAGKETTTWYEYLSASASITASMITTIAQIHSVTGYAQGGIVKGNSYSGDNIGAVVDGNQLVGLNAGEVVLTRAMQGNLAEQLEGGSRMDNLHLEAIVRGDDLVMVLNNNDSIWGRGDYVTNVKQ